MSSEPSAGFQQIGYMLKRAQHSLRTRMDAELRDVGLTAPSYAVLLAVAHSPGISNAALARTAFVTPQTMQGIVASLERAGLLVRAPDRSHGRILQTQLTARGHAVLDEAYAIAGKVEERLVRGLSAAEHAELLSALERCVANLNDAR